MMQSDSDKPSGDIVSTKDRCPNCSTLIIDKGRYVGLWDGDGCGNLYAHECPVCNVNLIGIENAWDESEKGITWETRLVKP